MTEQELLDHLAATSVPNLKRMEYGFSHWDCEAHYDTSLGRIEYVLELKCRNLHYDRMLIEQPKWDWLIQEATRRNGRAAYINATPRGIFAWDLMRVQEPAWLLREMPETTAYDRTAPIPKVVGFLPISEAMVLP
jgi:hypothetical protein